MLQPWKVPLLETPLHGNHGNTAVWPRLILRHSIVTYDKHATESRKLSQMGDKLIPASLHLDLSQSFCVTLFN